MPTATGSFILLLLLLLSCAIGINAFHQFINTNGTIPQQGQVLVLSSNPLDVTSYPGPFHFTLSAGFSVDLCVSPFAAVTFNLSQNCPPSGLLQYIYNNGTANDPFQLFLNDYSFSFRGRSELQSEASSLGANPFTHITKSLSSSYLLQNLVFYISLQFQDDTSKNNTETGFSLTVDTTADKCTSGIPTNGADGSQRCETPVGPTLNNNLTRNTYTVSEATPQFFEFRIGVDGLLVPSFTINLFVPPHKASTIKNIKIIIAYGQYPTDENAQYTLETTPTEQQWSIFESFNNVTNFTAPFLAPLPGIYYALMSSTEKESRDIELELIQANCTFAGVIGTDTPATGECGALDYQTIGNKALNLKFANGTVTYFAVPDSTFLQLGVTTAQPSNNDPFIFFTGTVGFNFFPSPGQPFVQSQPSRNGQLLFSFNNTDGISTNYIVGLLGPAGVPFTIWQGSQCPENCNGNGVCQLDLTCKCNGGFNGDFCQNKNKKLSTLYIILIIIGGAIVLAVLIGVPVALYLNNRKRARYERV